MPARLRGAALIMVLSLLVGSSIIGISAMSLSLTGERLAGNQKASLQARMIAESAAAELFGSLGAVMQTATADGEPPKCVSEEQREALWANDEAYSVYPPGADSDTFPQARVVICNASDDEVENSGRTSAAILGLAGNARHPARYPATVSVRENFAGLATTNFIGGIAEDADIQWPNSQNSRLDMGPGGKAIYFDELVGSSHADLFQTLIDDGDLDAVDYTALDKAALIASMGNQTDKIIDGSPQAAIAAAQPDRDGINSTIDLLQDIYQTCQGEGNEAAAAVEPIAEASGSKIPPGQAKNKNNKGGKPDKDNPDQGGGADKDNPGQGGGSDSGLCNYVRIVPPGAPEFDTSSPILA